MNKKKIIILILFLIFVVILGVFIKIPTHTERTTRELQVGGFFIEFEDGTTESEVKDILESCNMPNYSIDYNSDIMQLDNYIVVDNTKTKGIMDELRKEDNWTDPIFPAFKKGNSYIIPITKKAIEDESFLEIMKKNNLQVKKPILCLILFEDGPIDWMNVAEINNELGKNEKVLIVSPDYLTG